MKEVETRNFVTFLNKRCGISRDNMGKLTSEASKVETLDALVKEFVSASSDEKNATLYKIEEEVRKLEVLLDELALFCIQLHLPDASIYNSSSHHGLLDQLWLC